MLPDTRDKSLIPGVSAVPSAMLHNVQDWICKLRNAQLAGDVAISDDFLGPSVNDGLWSTTGTVAIVGAAGEGHGIVKVDATASGATLRCTGTLELGIKDFECWGRMKFPNYATAQATAFQFGIGLANPVVFQVRRSLASVQTVQVLKGGVTTATAFQNGTEWRFYKIRRRGTVLQFLVDDVVVFEDQAFVDDLGASGIFALTFPGGSTSSLAHVDAVGLFVGRVSPTGGLPVGEAGDAGHYEGGTATFAEGGAGAGFDYVDVAFAKAFLDASYATNPPVVVTDGLGPPGCFFVTNKTAAGFRLNTPGQFVGTYSWRAWK